MYGRLHYLIIVMPFEIEDDTLADRRREQIELYCYEGNYTILNKHDGIRIAIIKTISISTFHKFLS